MFSRTYIINWAEESLWAILFAAGGFLATWFTTTDVSAVTDWKAVLIAAGLGLGRVALAVAANQVRKLFAGTP